MKTLVIAFLAIVVFCLTFFGGIYFFHQDIVAKLENIIVFCVLNGAVGTLMFFAVKSVAKVK